MVIFIMGTQNGVRVNCYGLRRVSVADVIESELGTKVARIEVEVR